MTAPAEGHHQHLHELHHDPHHKAEADLVDKGLSEDAVGLFGSTILGISSVAPAYTLTATIGLLVAAVARRCRSIFIAGFLPMFFAAYAYRELNKVAPDCGTSFTWTTKAFGPYIGWIGGWAAVARDRHRAVEPGRGRGAVLLPADRRRLEQRDHQHAVGEPGSSTWSPA